MINDIWINLPVKNVQQSKAFFKQLGFEFNTQYGDTDVSAGFVIGKKVVMLFEESMFKGFAGNELSDVKKGTEVLFSIGAESKADVDELAQKVEAAGGTLYSKPAINQGWMYGCAFIDLDGHRWNALYMDMSKMPK
ncbi:MAG: extradiol dioxygenase [Chitinophagaceae bacterium]|nr:extradiol dioxygenase [Chitinophagaceae bacterium]